MIDFHSYYKRCQSQLRLESKTTLSDTIADDALSAGLGGMIGNKKEAKFRALAKSVANDKKFLSDYSEAIGEPRETETEDEFVDRAKIQLTAMLKKKLKVK